MKGLRLAGVRGVRQCGFYIVGVPLSVCLLDLGTKGHWSGMVIGPSGEP